MTRINDDIVESAIADLESSQQGRMEMEVDLSLQIDPDKFAGALEDLSDLERDNGQARPRATAREVYPSPLALENLHRERRRRNVVREIRGLPPLGQGILRDPDLGPLIVDEVPEIKRMVDSLLPPERVQYLRDKAEFEAKHGFLSRTGIYFRSGLIETERALIGSRDLIGRLTGQAPDDVKWSELSDRELASLAEKRRAAIDAEIVAGRSPETTQSRGDVSLALRAEEELRYRRTQRGGDLYHPRDPVATGFGGGFDLAREIPKAAASSAFPLGLGGVGSVLGPWGFAGGVFLGSALMEIGDQWDSIALDENHQLKLEPEVVPDAMAIVLLTGSLAGAAENMPGFGRITPIGMATKSLRRNLVRAAARRLGTKGIGRAGIVRRVALAPVLGAAGEGFEETIQESLAVTAETLVHMRENGIPFDADTFLDLAYTPANRDRVMYATGAGVSGGFGLGAASTPARIAAEQRMKAQADENKRVFTDLSEKVVETKLHKRAPTKLRTLLQQVTDGTDTETTYITADTFLDVFDNPDDPVAQQLLTELEERIPGLADQVELARTGADVAIPTSDFAAYIAPTPVFEQLSGALKFDPKSTTADEMEAYESATEAARLQQMARRALEKEADAILADADEAEVTTRMEREALVRDDVAQELTGLGLPKSVADANAQIFARGLTRIAALEGVDVFDLYQSEGVEFIRSEIEDFKAGEGVVEQRYGSGTRGFFAPADETAAPVIALTSNANLSTVAHESAHFLFDLLHRLATSPDASTETLEFWDVLKTWLQIDDAQRELTEEQQEKFAESFELYLREGKAPHEDLKGVFAKFKDWLLRIYESVTQRPRGQINDEVRAIFDNLLAGDLRARSEMEAQGAGEVAIPEKPEGWSDAKWNAYLKRVGVVRDDITARMQASEQEKLTKAQSKAAKEARKVYRTTARFAYESRPAPRARYWLRNGTVYDETPAIDLEHAKLDRGLVESILTEGQVAALPKGVMAGRGKPALSAEDTQNLAMSVGFESTGDMLRGLGALGKESDAKLVNAEAELTLRRDRPDLFKSELELEEQAAEIVSGDEGQRRLLAWQITELRKLARQAPEAEQAERAELPADPEAEVSDARDEVDRLSDGDDPAALQEAVARLRLAEEQARVARRRRAEARGAQAAQRDALSYVNPRLVKAQARQFVLTMPAGSLQSVIARFRATSKRSSREAVMASSRGDYTTGAIELERQLLALEIVEAATGAQREIAKGFKKAKTYKKAKLKKLRKYTPDLVEQILIIYRKIDLKASAPSIDPEERRQLSDIVTEYIESYGMVWPGPEFLNTPGTRNWKQMPVSDLLDTFAAVNTLEKWAYEFNEVLAAEAAMERQNKRQELIGAIERNMKTGKNPVDQQGPLGVLRTGLRMWANELITPQALFDRLDGEQVGPWNLYVWGPVKDAANWTRERMQREAQAIEDLYSQFYTKDELVHFSGARAQKFQVGSRMLTKAELLGLAAHWGNLGGQRAVVESTEHAITELEALTAFDTHLDDRDLDFLEAKWKYYNSFRPEVGELMRRDTGTTPVWVEAQPYMVRGRLVSGGYAPLQYDSKHSRPNVAQREDKENAQSMFPRSAAHAQTRQGHTQARVGSAGQMPKLDFTKTLPVHVHNVVTDLGYREVVKDVFILVSNDHATMKALRDAVGPEIDSFLASWLERQVSPRYLARTVTEHAVDYMTQASAISILGGSLATMALNVTGMIPAIGMVKASTLASSYDKLFTGSRLLGGTTEAGGWESYMKGLAAIREVSPEMRKRFNTFDATVAETSRRLVGSTAGKLTSLQRMSVQASFGAYGVIDQIVAGGVWMAAYTEAIEGQLVESRNVPKGNHERAVKWADKVVQRTQGDGAIESIARVQEKNNPFLRMLTVFITYALTQFNQHANKLNAARVNPGKHAAGYAQWLFIMLFVMPVIEGVMRAAVKAGDPGEDDEFAELWVYYAVTAATTSNVITGGVPVVRDLLSALSPILKGEQPYDLSLSPSTASLDSATRAIAELAKGTDADPTKATVLTFEAIGPWFKIPTPHMVRFAEIVSQEELR